MEKRIKIEGKFKNGKNLKKEDICFRWELNSKSFVIAEVGNYLENIYNEKKRIFAFVVNSKPFIMADVGNYLENRSNGY